jgi:hypothetical protein
VDGLVDTLDGAGAWPNYDLFPCNLPAGNPPPGLANPKDIYVDGSSVCLIHNGEKNCSLLSGPFLTVSQALGVSCAGDRLFIRAGSYNQSVTFNRYMTVRSYDGSAVIGH